MGSECGEQIQLPRSATGGSRFDDHLFCMITMNHHPLHTNQWFAENETVHGKNVVLHEFGYDGHVGLEFHPTGTTSTAVQHLRDTFQVLFTHMPEMGSE